MLTEKKRERVRFNLSVDQIGLTLSAAFTVRVIWAKSFEAFFRDWAPGVSYAKKEKLSASILLSNKLQIAADRTRNEMGMAEKFVGRAKEMAESVLADASFSIAQFMSKEQLLVNFRNFESLSEDDIKEILIKHYTLKLMGKENIDDKDI